MTLNDLLIGLVLGPILLLVFVVVILVYCSPSDHPKRFPPEDKPRRGGGEDKNER